MNRHKCRWNCDWSRPFRIYLSPFLFFFPFFFYIFIHYHPLLSNDPNFKSLAHRQVSIKSITKFCPDRQTRKRVNKNMVINLFSLATVIFWRLTVADIATASNINMYNQYTYIYIYQQLVFDLSMQNRKNIFLELKKKRKKSFLNPKEKKLSTIFILYESPPSHFLLIHSNN